MTRQSDFEDKHKAILNKFIDDILFLQQEHFGVKDYLLLGANTVDAAIELQFTAIGICQSTHPDPEKRKLIIRDLIAHIVKRVEEFPDLIESQQGSFESHQH